MSNTVVTIVKGRNAGTRGVVLGTATAKTVWVEGCGTVLRSSLSIDSQRALRAIDNGVTWEWLRETLSVAEACAWLGLD